MLQLENNQFILIGAPGSRRIELFQEALKRLALPPACFISYLDLITGAVSLPKIVLPGSIIKLESPDRNFALEKALLLLGADRKDDLRFTSLTADAVRELEFDKGRIYAPRQWYRGFCALLDLIAQQLAECPPHLLLNKTADIRLMFDKAACHRHLATQGIPVPAALPPVYSWSEWNQAMQRKNLQRAFLKLAHGSSASGTAAYRTNGRDEQIVTTVEMVETDDGKRTLYNNRRQRMFTNRQHIAQLIELLCHHNLHCEAWIPKASLRGKCFDLRVVVIDGKVAHTIARLSQTPITNLHLLNERLDIETCLSYIPAQTWEAACETCERVMRTCFPNSHYAGIDLMISSGMRHHYVLEVNAFGDLLNGVYHQGQDTYMLEIISMLNRP